MGAYKPASVGYHNDHDIESFVRGISGVYATDPEYANKILGIERIMREIRRRTRVVGIFPDGKSALMLVCARLRHVTTTAWGEKRYLNMQRLFEQEKDVLMDIGCPFLLPLRWAPFQMCEKLLTVPGHARPFVM